MLIINILTSLTAEREYSVNLYTQIKNLYEVYTIMEATAFCLLMLQKYINLKQKSQKWNNVHYS